MIKNCFEWTYEYEGDIAYGAVCLNFDHFLEKQQIKFLNFFSRHIL